MAEVCRAGLRRCGLITGQENPGEMYYKLLEDLDGEPERGLQPAGSLRVVLLAAARTCYLPGSVNRGISWLPRYLPVTGTKFFNDSSSTGLLYAHYGQARSSEKDCGHVGSTEIGIFLRQRKLIM